MFMMLKVIQSRLWVQSAFLSDVEVLCAPAGEILHRARFFYGHETHSELQNAPNEGVQRCHVTHASFYQAPQLLVTFTQHVSCFFVFCTHF